ncbi:MAG TPA: molybdopterin-dependent oxidoreductase [Nitrospiria bacterium]
MTMKMPSWNRRRFLQISSLSGLFTLLHSQARGAMFFMKKLLSRSPRETHPVTPTSEFYVYDVGRMSRMIEDLDYSEWVLNVKGRVKNPLGLTQETIRERPIVRLTSTIECIENPVGGTSIGNAVWGGVRLGDLLTEAGADSRAKKVIFRAADGYSDSIPLERAMDTPVLLAYEMNGEPLPRSHGFPLRAVVPGIYGMKQVKWIMEIEVSDEDYQGYWQQRGWSDEATVRTMSRIDSPGPYQELRGPEHEIRGVAFAGSKGIEKVEVSTDGGLSWNTARLDDPLSPHCWVIWRYTWTVKKPGVHRIVVRATNGKGNVQTSEEEAAYPDGTTGLHAIVVDNILEG